MISSPLRGERVVAKGDRVRGLFAGDAFIALEVCVIRHQALTRRGALPVPEVVEILQQAARGLTAAHKLGIIHRDLKPDNIFLTYPDDESVAPVSPPANVQVTIVDFGIAKLLESAAHTQTGMVLGTPAYMAFEQASVIRNDELDARSDVYSLGVVVYEMLIGRAPFHSDTPVGYVRKHLQDAPPPFNAVAPGCPTNCSDCGDTLPDKLFSLPASTYGEHFLPGIADQALAE